MRTNEAHWIEKTKRWQIKVQKDGVRKTFNCSTTGKKGKIECEKKADKFLETGVMNTSVRFGKAFNEFLEETKLLSSTTNFKKHSSIGNNHLLPILEHKKVSSLSTQLFQQSINNAYKNGLSKKTLQNIRGTITKFLSYCAKSGYEVPTIYEIVIPKNARVEEKHILQPDKLKLLFEDNDINNNTFYIHAFRFLVLTGLRRGELCGLKSCDIKNDIVNIRRSINQLLEVTDGKTKQAKRQFVLSTMMKKTLYDQKIMLKNLSISSPYIFPNQYNNHISPNVLSKVWEKYRQNYGIDCSLHELRHTFISISQADVPEQLLKRTVGHSKSMDTFGVYGHSVDGEMERVADILDVTFNKFLK